MALVVADRVQETTSTTGTSDYVLLGAATGYQSFGAVLANADTTYYAITNDTDWEVGIGTYSTTGPTLARTTILASSNGGSAVSWGVGVKNIFISYAASKASFLDANGDLLVADKIVHTGDTNTAIRFPTADTVSIETGGTERFKVENSTITTTVPIVLPADPTLPLQAATKEYVDTIASAGIHYHAPVRVESPINLNATYNNGTSGVGATLTNAGTQVALVIDGVTVATNDRVLVYQQTNQTQNGVYVVTNTGSGSTNWVLTRSTDTDSYGPSDPDALGAGDAFFVQQGATGAGELYVCNTEGTITFGTTNITFTQIAATAVYTAGTGISVADNVITNTAPDQTVTLTQGGATTITGTYPNFTISSTDTTYSAGDGIGLAGTTFSVAAGSGLTQDADGLSHADTSSQASVDNTGATFVQDINLDGFGHVTGAASVTVTPSLIGAPQNDGTGATGTWGISITGNADNVSGTVAVANGGTGATTAGQALDNLSAAPRASPVFTGNMTVDTDTFFVDGTNNRVGVGTVTPATKAEISGSSPAACLFTATVTGTTLDVTAVSSGALAVGQYLLNSNQRVRITALGTGTGGVGTYTLDSDQTGIFYAASYVLEPTTLRLANSATSYTRAMPFGAIEFGGAVTNVGPRGFIQVGGTNSTLSSGGTAMIFGAGNGSGSTPPRTTMFLNTSQAVLPGSLQLGQSSLSPRNLTINPATIGFNGRSQTIYSSGATLSSLFFSTSYIDASVETFATYGQIGYLVDSSITSGQLPSNFFISTRNASGITAERFRIDKDGNVGIGTTAPAAKLEVNGTAQVTGVLNVGGQLLSSSSGTTSAPALADATGVSGISFPSGHVAISQASTERMRINASGYVGIGTTSPAYRLDVSGDVRLGGTVGILKDPGSFSLDVFGYINADGLAIGGTAITATAAELNFVDGVTSNIQTQLDSKGPKGGGSNAVFYENDQTVTDDYTIPAGKNAMSTGPVTVNAGVTVTVSAGARYVVI